MNSIAARPERAVLADCQHRFAAYIRNPGEAALPEGIAPERMALYHELFFNNVEEALSDAFPLLQRQLGAAPWQRLLRDFFARHLCRSPYFPRLPAELILFLTGEGEAYPRWAVELAHYEWIELELALQEAEPPTVAAPSTDFATHAPVLSPLARMVSYAHPVHYVADAQTPEEWKCAPEPIHLLVYRDFDERVRWLELRPMIARLLDLIAEERDRSATDLLEQVAAEFGYPDVPAAVAGGLAALEALRQRGVIAEATLRGAR